MNWNCVFTSGLIPTPPMPGWKLPDAVGWRSPIFRLAFTLSTDRSWGACSTRVLVSLRAASSRALGRLIEKSELAMRPRLESGMDVPGVEGPGFTGGLRGSAGSTGSAVDGTVGTRKPGRGENVTGTLSP